MSLKSFPAARAAIVALTVLTLSFPAANTFGAAPAPRQPTRPAPADSHKEASLWEWLLGLLPAGGSQPPAHGNGGCEMDPDGVVHVPPPPKPCV
jgi:hypothetical protein